MELIYAILIGVAFAIVATAIGTLIMSVCVKQRYFQQGYEYGVQRGMQDYVDGKIR